MAVGAQAATSAGPILRDRVADALERARRSGRPVVASATATLAEQIDVSACVFANRRAEERYFVWEEPDNDSFALGGMGAAWTIDDVDGERRFAEAARRCAEFMRDAIAETEVEWRGEGPVWLGGFTFMAAGGRSREWQSLPQTLMVLPELSIVRNGVRTSATINVVCRPGDDGETLVRPLLARLEGLRDASIPLVDPDPVLDYEISSVRPPQEYERIVGEARDRIRAGEFEKAVLAREVRVDAPAPISPGPVFDGLRAGYPSCYCFCVGTPEVAFVGASPELLVRRDGARLSTVALAGSTRRSADPSVDDHLGERLLHSQKDLAEHQIVLERIERSLAPLSVWVTVADEPGLIKMANIQHLATPVRAQLAAPVSVVELAGALHPTPAVGGEPWTVAERVVAELEHMDRGWYAGPVGWMDATEDGEFCVALRCALLEGSVAHCYAGVGIVADSDPEAELAETEVKLQALLAVLVGS